MLYLVFGIALAVEVERSIPTVYLSEDEVGQVDLDSFFSGDAVQYSISVSAKHANYQLLNPNRVALLDTAKYPGTKLYHSSKVSQLEVQKVSGKQTVFDFWFNRILIYQFNPSSPFTLVKDLTLDSITQILDIQRLVTFDGDEYLYILAYGPNSVLGIYCSKMNGVDNIDQPILLDLPDIVVYENVVIQAIASSRKLIIGTNPSQRVGQLLFYSISEDPMKPELLSDMRSYRHFPSERPCPLQIIEHFEKIYVLDCSGYLYVFSNKIFEGADNELWYYQAENSIDYIGLQDISTKNLPIYSQNATSIIDLDMKIPLAYIEREGFQGRQIGGSFQGQGYVFSHLLDDDYQLCVDKMDDNQLWQIGYFNIKELVGEGFMETPRIYVDAEYIPNNFIYVRSDFDGLRLFDIELGHQMLQIWEYSDNYKVQVKAYSQLNKHDYKKQEFKVKSISSYASEILLLNGIYHIDENIAGPFYISFTQDRSTTQYIKLDQLFSGPNIKYSIINQQYPQGITLTFNNLNTLTKTQEIDEIAVNAELLQYGQSDQMIFKGKSEFYLIDYVTKHIQTIQHPGTPLTGISLRDDIVFIYINNGTTVFYISDNTFTLNKACFNINYDSYRIIVSCTDEILSYTVEDSQLIQIFSITVENLQTPSLNVLDANVLNLFPLYLAVADSMYGIQLLDYSACVQGGKIDYLPGSASSANVKRILSYNQYLISVESSGIVNIYDIKQQLLKLKTLKGCFGDLKEAKIFDNILIVWFEENYYCIYDVMKPVHSSLLYIYQDSDIMQGGTYSEDFLFYNYTEQKLEFYSINTEIVLQFAYEIEDLTQFLNSEYQAQFTIRAENRNSTQDVDVKCTLNFENVHIISNTQYLTQLNTSSLNYSMSSNIYLTDLFKGNNIKYQVNQNQLKKDDLETFSYYPSFDTVNFSKFSYEHSDVTVVQDTSYVILVNKTSNIYIYQLQTETYQNPTEPANFITSVDLHKYTSFNNLSCSKVHHIFHSKNSYLILSCQEIDESDYIQNLVIAISISIPSLQIGEYTYQSSWIPLDQIQAVSDDTAIEILAYNTALNQSVLQSTTVLFLLHVDLSEGLSMSQYMLDLTKLFPGQATYIVNASLFAYNESISIIFIDNLTGIYLIQDIDYPQEFKQISDLQELIGGGIRGNLMITLQYSTLYIYDISQLPTISLLSTFPNFKNDPSDYSQYNPSLDCLDISPNNILITSIESSTQTFLRVIDLSNTRSPKILIDIDIGSNITPIRVPICNFITPGYAVVYNNEDYSFWTHYIRRPYIQLHGFSGEQQQEFIDKYGEGVEYTITAYNAYQKVQVEANIKRVDDPVESDSDENSSNTEKYWYLWVLVGASGLMVIFVGVIVYCRQKRRPKVEGVRDHGVSLINQSTNSV